MSLHSSKMLSLKDQLAEDEKNLKVELEAIAKAKVRASKEEKGKEEKKKK